MSLLRALKILIASTAVVAAVETYKNPDATVDQRVDDLLARMTLPEKISQMIQDASNSVDAVPNLGSYLVGASDPPEGNNPVTWRQHMNYLQGVSANKRLGIPVLIATDAVHGQNIVSGATIFPHNIGLGMTRNPALLQEIANATASEMISTGLDMTFAPTVTVARTMTWGRTYESYSESTDVVSSYVSSFILGLQSSTTPWQVVGTAKHWIGDGGTTAGDDAGDTQLSESQLLAIHSPPFVQAINAGVGVIMVSFSSVNGVKMHQNKRLIQEVLKGDLGFQGFVLSDWLGFSTIQGSYDTQIREAVNAGIDMLMCPYQAWGCYGTILDSVNRGLIAQSRIDDAVRRILRIKFKAGLFEKKINPIDPNNFQAIGTTAHREVARRAVRQSLVLLKNREKTLPLNKSKRIFLAGKNANNIRNQCGGWTMSWQGTSTEPRHTIVGGTTILRGFEQLSTGSTTFREDGTGLDSSLHDVAIVVVGETPYAEGAGDKLDLSLDSFDKATINNVRNKGVPIILVIVSGRPMIVTEEISWVDAVVAAWLPGTEGAGIAEILYGDYDFTGKLSFSWPADMSQVLNGFIGTNPNVLFQRGYGLSYKTIVPAELPAPSPAKPPIGSQPSPSSQLASCSAHPGCAQLSGNCCPTPNGTRLACCSKGNAPTLPMSAPVLPPVKSTPVSTGPTPSASLATCSAHPGCAQLTGNCCPTPTGTRLACCSKANAPTLPMPAPLPPPVKPTPVSTGSKPSASLATCSAHPGCAQLTGDCCPTPTGTRLACCSKGNTPTLPASPSRPSPTAPAQPPGLSSASCKANAACASLTGNCCPTTDGVVLACCHKSVSVSALENLEYSATSSGTAWPAVPLLCWGSVILQLLAFGW